MSYLLRHGCQKNNVPIREDGYITMDDLLTFLNNGRNKVTLLMVERVVNNNEKKRFQIEEFGSPPQLFIRAV